MPAGLRNQPKEEFCEWGRRMGSDQDNLLTLCEKALKNGLKTVLAAQFEG